MLLFDRRTGPDFGVTYPSERVPDWYRDAKLGVFVHWGLFSLPGWAVTRAPGEAVPAELEWSHHQYAEWYANTLRIPGSPTRGFHEETFGVGTSYEDLADLWRAERFDPAGWVREFADCGVRYVVPVTKHHDGFCLWPTETTGFNSVARGPRRDVVGELSSAVRAANLRLGLYYSGALDWHVTDFPPIESLRDLFTYRRNDRAFADFCHAQARELIQRYSPDVLWNDIDWPDAGKDAGPTSLAALFEEYFAAVPDGVLNDRWGVPYLGYRTREYLNEEAVTAHVWEACRGLGASFGYNRAEDDRHLVGETELVHLLVDTVAKNGNLLINIGPRGDGTLPANQLDRLRFLGAWLRDNGDAVYGTRPWVRHGEPVGDPVRYTVRDDTLYVLALDPARGELRLAPDVAAAGRGYWLGGAGVDLSAGTVPVPEALRKSAAAVLAVPGMR
ncbi:alpha-L-fucosidase [Actinocatenispora rupis]|uniref:alpha-L-fucosidase n=1 Tax=Actinocatenispora rupis TaxID=519421 RepID=A0A8J3J730_9ACTN|nr:alpha-L-fucosidase [Actinocatenispora rupis]GID13202.1 alpha-L-fucosidase [Actinocatenispora rupis]